MSHFWLTLNMDSEKITVKFAQIIKLLRTKESLKQSELADRLGVDRSSISNYETGHRMPTVEFLLSISEHFNVSIDFLLKGTSHVDKSSRPNDSILNELMAENIVLIENIIELNKSLEETQKEINTLKELTKAQFKLLNL